MSGVPLMRVGTRSRARRPWYRVFGGSRSRLRGESRAGRPCHLWVWTNRGWPWTIAPVTGNRADISSSGRIGMLTRLMSEIGRLTDPREAFELFARGLRQVFDTVTVAQLSTLGLPPGRFRIFALRTADGVEHCPACDPSDQG